MGKFVLERGYFAHFCAIANRATISRSFALLDHFWSFCLNISGVVGILSSCRDHYLVEEGL